MVLVSVGIKRLTMNYLSELSKNSKFYLSELSNFLIFVLDNQVLFVMQEYIQRNIDVELLEWKNNPMRKPLLLRGARQVGKSSAVRHFGKEFKYFAEVNFERHKAVKTFFQGDIDIRLIAQKIAKYINVPIEEGETLLFLDEIQECPEAIMSLRLVPFWSSRFKNYLLMAWDAYTLCLCIL